MSEWISDAPVRGPRGELVREGERIAFESYGEGSALVLTHGLGGSHASWFQQVPVFARRFRVLTFDQRGFGRSTNQTGKAGPASAAGDLAALLDQQGIECAHLVGQSMGGWTVMAFALAHPRRVRSLTLADTPGGIPSPRVADAFRDFAVRMSSAPPPDRWPLDRHPALGSALGRRDPARAFLYDQIASLAPPPPASIPLELVTTTHDAARVAALEMPKLFVVGEHDPIFPPDVIRDAASMTTRSRFTIVPESGHSPYFERPELWNEEVLGFLDEVEQSAID